MTPKDQLDAPRRDRPISIGPLAALPIPVRAVVAACVIAAASFTLFQACLHQESRGSASEVLRVARAPLAPAASAAVRIVPPERTSEPQAPARFTFAVLSDIHVESSGGFSPALPGVIAAVVATRPRFVAITGDFTYGEPWDPIWKQQQAGAWWRTVRELLRPIREAGIPVLPVAGNHDSHLAVYRRAYAAAWHDLDEWAAPLPIRGQRQPPDSVVLDAAPFTYATDVDGIHLTFAHVVDEKVDPAVASWLRADLALARAAPLRFFFAHVPVAAMGLEVRREFDDDFRKLLETGHVDVYVAGHEHLSWDDDVPLPGGASLRQVVVGTAAGLWHFGPNAAARRRARCVDQGARLRCWMPRQDVPFELHFEDGSWIQKEPRTFTLLTIDGSDVTTRMLAVDDRGAVSPFGEDDTAEAPEEALDAQRSAP